MRTRVLAEPGSTAEGDLGRYERLIDAAARAGATAFKNQWTSSPVRMCARRHAGPEYLASYAKIAYPVAWHARLAGLCRSVAMEYGCAVYLPEDVWPLEPHVDFFKLASFEAQDMRLLATMLATGKPIIVSTGMQDLPRDYGYERVEYLHCVSAYPCPRDQASLAVLRLRGSRPGFHFAGYSDHTRDVLTGAFAVCAGARILEVHFRLDDTDPANLDYATALSPAELIVYVDLIQQAEAMLGDGEKKPQPAEAAMTPYRVEDGPR